ncbi:hypothetical protein QF049_006109 [Paenibacillus sp. W4I10]|uniref:hypothetical protein n=1 Tax=Paenibacillus sp. W4I10 TaxID=3042298 RepID=UPI002783CA5D|nr:hypothetical protein [Paenibacillus sp. W4I10]MDQ0724848.1 hypothetical protein [Paenibacillus sp. W4I10]
MKRHLVVCMLILLLVTSGLALFPEERVYACSCVESDVQERLKTNTTVFTGEVVKKGRSQQSKHDGLLREYTFDVDTAWKGVNAKKMKILASDGGSESCGIQFEKNQSYLIYAYQYEVDYKLHTNLCSRNVPIEQAGDDLKLLGAGNVISKEDFGELVGEVGLSILSYTVQSFYWQHWKSCGYGNERKESDCRSNVN